MSASATTSAAALPAAGVKNRRMITLSIMLATIMQALDTTIANVALPHMQGSLSASQDQITWVLTSYIVAAAIATPMTGWLCARFTRKAVFLVSVAGFTVASALCGLSETLPQIVIARLLQGLFGASLVPLSQAVLLDINPREKQGEAMAMWGMGVMVGPILGPTIGGWLTDSYNWRWVFFINLPIGAFAFFGILTYIKEHTGKLAQRFDFFGFATLALAIGLLQAMLDRGEQQDWFSSVEIWIEALGSAIAFAFFVAHTMTAGKDSFFNARLLRDRNFVSGLFFIFVVGVVLYATRALLPPMLQNLMGYPVVTTGLVTAPSGAGTMLAMVFVGRLINRIDLRVLIGFGFALTALSLWQMMHYTIDLTESDIVIPGIIQGIGLGFVFVPLSSASFSTLPAPLRPDGTAIYSLSRNIGSSLGISIVQTLLTQNTQVAHSVLAEHITRFNPLLQGSGFDAGSAVGLASLDQLVTAQANMIAYIDNFKLMFVLTLIALPLLLLIRPARKPADAAAAHAAMD